MTGASCSGLGHGSSRCVAGQARTSFNCEDIDVVEDRPGQSANATAKLRQHNSRSFLGEMALVTPVFWALALIALETPDSFGCTI